MFVVCLLAPHVLSLSISSLLSFFNSLPHPYLFFLLPFSLKGDPKEWCVCMPVCVNLCVCVCVSIHAHVFLCVCMCEYAYVSMHVYVCLLVCMHVCGMYIACDMYVAYVCGNLCQ